MRFCFAGPHTKQIPKDLLRHHLGRDFLSELLAARSAFHCHLSIELNFNGMGSLQRSIGNGVQSFSPMLNDCSRSFDLKC